MSPGCVAAMDHSKRFLSARMATLVRWEFRRRDCRNAYARDARRRSEVSLLCAVSLFSLSNIFDFPDGRRHRPVCDGIPRLAVALMYFTGLRPGEARAARWEDYDAKRKTLRVSASMWRLHLTSPKTPESVAPVPVGETLAEMLGEVRKESGFILSSPTGKAVDLHNLAFREVKPALAKCAKCRQPKAEHDSVGHEFQHLPKWRGWYALRRGCATLATSVDSQIAAKSLLRHSNIATPQTHYIKSVPSEAVRAVEKMDALFQKSNVSATPN